jgi:hypothetical protein
MKTKLNRSLNPNGGQTMMATEKQSAASRQSSGCNNSILRFRKITAYFHSGGIL